MSDRWKKRRKRRFDIFSYIRRVEKMLEAMMRRTKSPIASSDPSSTKRKEARPRMRARS